MPERPIQRARQLRHDMTDAERQIWQYLRQRQVDRFKFRRQAPLGPYIADFVCLDARLVIEIDGGQHGGERDAKRERWLHEQGFRVLRFWNNEIASNLDGVYRRIEDELRASVESESPWARARSSRSGRHPHPNPSAVEGEGLKNVEREGLKKDAREVRLYGLNACLAAFAKRPQALRKVYLTEARIPVLKNVLAWCVKHRLGYRVVADADLEKLTSSRHHEGVCFDMLREAPIDLAQLLARQPQSPAPSLLLWLDGVGNPHNLGALLRSAAHFGAGGAIVPAESGLDVSGAAARVAEGAAEIVPLAHALAATDIRAALHAAGYRIAATVPRDGVSLYETPLPPRLVFAFGAEGEGMSTPLIDAADLKLTIPGSGAIESLNVAASVAVMLGEYWRQHPGAASAKPRNPRA